MICKFCGNIENEGAKFCTKCGHPLEEEIVVNEADSGVQEQENTAAVSAEENAVQSEPPVQEPPVNTAQPDNPVAPNPAQPIPGYVQAPFVVQQPYMSSEMPKVKSPEGKGLAIGGMVCGIVALAMQLVCCCAYPFAQAGAFIVGVVGLILSAVAKSKRTDYNGQAVAGVICSIIAIVLSVLFIILAVLGIMQFDVYGDELLSEFGLNGYNMFI